jgi:hypothetical protein
MLSVEVEHIGSVTMPYLRAEFLRRGVNGPASSRPEMPVGKSRSFSILELAPA